MKRKLFPLISILTLIVLLVTAATCNMCGLNLSTETTASTTASTQASETEETTKATIAEDTNEEKTTDTAKSSSSETSKSSSSETSKSSSSETSKSSSSETSKSSSTDSQAIAPTIKLQIYEGPIYSQSDNVYYYRIEAVVTGEPKPDIKFSKDDSNGTFGANKTQVNLTVAIPSYFLTATATNPAGSATASIDLSRPIDKQKLMLPGDISIYEIQDSLNLNLKHVITEEGTIDSDTYDLFHIFNGPDIVVGDRFDNMTLRGFASFDITGLAGATIQEATLTMKPFEVLGDPTGLGSFWIVSVDYGARPIISEDYGRASILIEMLNPVGKNGNITCNSPKLVTEIQNFIDAKKTRFQLRFFFPGYFCNINVSDYWRYNSSGINLNITYKP